MTPMASALPFFLVGIQIRLVVDVVRSVFVNKYIDYTAVVRHRCLIEWTSRSRNKQQVS